MGIDQKFYDASYFETGTKDKKSCYENYGWMQNSQYQWRRV